MQAIGEGQGAFGDLVLVTVTFEGGRLNAPTTFVAKFAPVCTGRLKRLETRVIFLNEAHFYNDFTIQVSVRVRVRVKVRVRVRVRTKPTSTTTSRSRTAPALTLPLFLPLPLPLPLTLPHPYPSPDPSSDPDTNLTRTARARGPSATSRRASRAGARRPLP